MGTTLIANTIPDVVASILTFQVSEIVIALLIGLACLMVIGFLFRIPYNAFRGRPIFEPITKKGT